MRKLSLLFILLIVAAALAFQYTPTAPTPTLASGIANKAYVDTAASAIFASPPALGSTTPGIVHASTFDSIGLLTAYDGITVAGLSFPVQVGVARLVAQTGNLGPTTLFTVGGASSQYLVVATIYCDSTSAAATVALTINYTDQSNTAQAIAPTAAACTALGAASFAVINTPIAAKNAIAITYSTVIANTPTYSVRIQVYQTSTN
jgi:hypothetical protein